MGFKVTFSGGPLAGTEELRRSAPETVWYADPPGVYRLDKLSGMYAKLVWFPQETGDKYAKPA